jgi:hypothetical protein
VTDGAPSGGNDESGCACRRSRCDRRHRHDSATCRRSVASSGITITTYFDDHGPPHFQVRHADGEAKVRIDRLEVIDGILDRRHLRLVLAWAELDQGELAENWRRSRSGERLNDIEPLR